MYCEAPQARTCNLHVVLNLILVIMLVYTQHKTTQKVVASKPKLQLREPQTSVNPTNKEAPTNVSNVCICMHVYYYQERMMAQSSLRPRRKSV